MKILKLRTTRALALFLALAMAASAAPLTGGLPDALAAGETITALDPAAVNGTSVTINFTITAPAAGGTVTVSAYPAGGAGSWISINSVDVPITGTTVPGSITLTLTSNNTGAIRTGDVMLVIDGSSAKTVTVTQMPFAVSDMTNLTSTPATVSFELNQTSSLNLTYTVTASGIGVFNVSIVSKPDWLTVTPANPISTTAAGTGAETVALSVAPTATPRSGNLVITVTNAGNAANTRTINIPVTQGVQKPSLSPATGVAIGAYLTVTTPFSNWSTIEIYSYADRRSGSLVDSVSYSLSYNNTCNFQITSNKYIAGQKYYVFIKDTNGTYSEATEFTVADKPPAPSVDSGQRRAAGDRLSMSNYPYTSNNYVFYVGTSNSITLDSNGIGSTTTLIQATVANYYQILLPPSLSKIGDHWLYVYDTNTKQLSLASANSFYITDAGRPARPELAADQRVKSGGTLKITSYNLSEGFEFVAVSSTNVHYPSASAGSSIVNVTMYGTETTPLPEGTYYLYVRAKNNPAVISERSLNSFVVDNTKPQIVSTTPANNAVGVSPLAAFSITFNEGMDDKAGVGTTVFTNTTAGGTRPGITKTEWSADKKTVTYTLSGVLPDTTYTATIYSTNNPGAGYTGFCDIAGNLLKDSMTVRFTTGAASIVVGDKSTIPVAGTASYKDGVASSAIDGASLASAAAQAAADELKGLKATVMLDVPIPADASVLGVKAEMPSAALNDLLNKTNGTGLTVKYGFMGTMNFDRDALLEISKTGTGTVALDLLKRDRNTLTPQQSNEIGLADPVYDFTASVGDRAVQSFGAGNVTVAVPYLLGYGVNPDQVSGWKIAADGTLTLAMGRYNSSANAFEFRLKGFSTYFLTYSPRTYNDVSGWFAEAVNYTAARGLLDTLTAGGSFEPTRTVTRAQFVTIFMKAYGIAPNASSQTVPFSDVSPLSEFYPYLLKAKEMGLVQGGGGNMFNPDGLVTREEFFTLTCNMLTAVKLMPAFTTGNGVDGFNDSGKVSGWARDSIDKLARAGIVEGDNNNNVTPDTRVNRSELAQLVYKLIR